MKNRFILSILPLFLYSCATVYQPTFSGDPNNYKIYSVDGKQLYGQHKNGITCEISPISTRGANFIYEVYVENNDTNPLHVSPLQVLLITHSLKGKKKITPAINVDRIIEDLSSKIAAENGKHESARRAVQNDKLYKTVGDLVSIGRKKSDEEKEKRRAEVAKRDSDWNLEVQRHDAASRRLNTDLNFWSNGTLKSTHLLYKNSVVGNVLIPRSNKVQKSTLKVNVGEGFDFDFEMNPVK